ncbi:protein STRUBBELIG-RECEPTOR FAMILY 3 isoform X3 [Mangifera indica]|nr:protein STRUBBELIG-RECEPTOR FAMILY 3 isoform X3 [Mangifera indica]
MNLGGTLVDSLGDFKSIIVLDLGNNHIGGSIPNNLPLTIRNFSLSGNHFTGSIPESLTMLSQLLDLSLSNNLLTGGIPDTFQQLTNLINLDLSANNLTGQLPPSMVDLSSLKTLHLQDNKLSGFLDVLQDLHLTDLNIENNLFSGPIPANLLTIPNFRKDGNPFNTTIIPSPSTALPPSIAWAPAPGYAPGNPAEVPSVSTAPKLKSARNFLTTKGVIWISVIGAVILFVLGACLFICRYCKGRKLKKDPERNHVGAHKTSGENPNNSKSSLQPNLPVEKVSIQPVSKEPIMKPQDGYGVDNIRINPKPQDEQLPPPPLLLPIVEKVSSKPPAPADVTRSHHPSMSLNCGSTIPFTIATLQQCTNSFSEENFIGEGLLGSVYVAELPDGKLVAVKKLGITACLRQSDDEFLGLVSRISKLQHPNIVNLVGYCNEHRQRLLVYEYCGNGTLHDLLHMDEENHKKLSWNMRTRMALGAARALQYLHEGCQPPIVHRNFKSANILLDEKLAVHVSDCGLDLLLSGSTIEFSGRTANGYGAPELESGSFTCQSDVYSLGVVMLELLTGRKSYDRSRPRGEHSLVRWAIPQLHDIDALSKMVDPSLNGAYPVKSLSRFADIISRCVQWEPGFRPPISEIVQDLLQMI